MNLCVDPNPSHRPETSRLLQLSFLKVCMKDLHVPKWSLFVHLTHTCNYKIRNHIPPLQLNCMPRLYMYMYTGVWDVWFGPCQLSCLGSSVGRASVRSTECRGFESHLRQLSFSLFHCLRCLSFFLSFFSTSPITSCM